MVFKVSAAAAKVVALDLKAFKPDPSATTWSRLEPLPTADDVSLGLQAPVADPLWLLARQWQFNELQGEDAGSPVAAQLRVLGVPMARLVHRSGAVPDVALPAGAPPIEAMVEQERVLGAHPKLNAQAGQHLMRMLRAAGQVAAIEPLRAAYAAVIADPADAAADNAGFVWHRLLDGRAIDAERLAAALRPLADDDAQVEAFVAALGIAPAAPVRGVLQAWLRWVDALALDPRSASGASPYWNPQRLEYAFGLRSDGVQPELRVEAEEYLDGRLDWDDFVVTTAAVPGQPIVGAAPIEWQPERQPLPALARYPGMPADRYWEFEDGRVNVGAIGAAKSDLARLAVLEYALVFGNDWYLLPVTLPVNALYKVAEFSVRDNFGIEVPIPPARNLDGTQWTMFEMSVQPSPFAPRPRLDDCLFLCPALHAHEGPPLEHVLLMRDEMANLAWAIEKKVQGASGEPLERRFEHAAVDDADTARRARRDAAARRAAALHAAHAGGGALDPLPAGQARGCDAVELVDPAAARRGRAALPGRRAAPGRAAQRRVRGRDRAAAQHAVRRSQARAGGAAGLHVPSARRDPATDAGRCGFAHQHRLPAPGGRGGAARRHRVEARLQLRARRVGPRAAVDRAQQDHRARRGRERAALRSGAPCG